MLDQLTRGIRRAEEGIIALLMAETIVVGIMQVAARYVFHSSLPWSEELLRFSFIWMTFLAASVGVAEKAHVSVSVLVDRLPKKAELLVNIIASIISAAFCAAIAYFGYGLLALQAETQQLSPAMEIPMWGPYLAVVVGSFSMAVRFLLQAAPLLRSLIG